MSEYLLCIGEEEPAGCNHQDNRSFSFRLSVATEEQVNAAARSRFWAVVDLLPTLRFAIYRLDDANWTRLNDPSISIIRDDEKPNFRPYLEQWIDHYPLEGERYAQAGTRAGEPSHREGIEARHFDAAQLLDSAAGKMAPFPQALGLAGIVRITADPDESDADKKKPRLLVPFPDGAVLPASFSNVETNSLVYCAYDSPVSDAGLAAPSYSLVGARSLPIRHVHLTTRIQEDGFVAPDSHSASTSKALSAFETRAGSLIVQSLFARTIAWPDFIEPKVSVEPKASEKITKDRTCLLVMRRIAWGAMQALASSLDVVLVAFAMPGAAHRDGPILRMFLADFEDALTNAGRESPKPKVLSHALRIALETIGLMGVEVVDAATRAALATRLRTYCRFDRLEPLHRDWLDSLVALLTNADRPAAWATALAAAAPLIPDDDDALPMARFAAIASEKTAAALTALDEALNSDKGLAETTASVLADLEERFIQELLAEGVPLSQEALRQAYTQALASFEDYDPAHALRRAAATLLADRLVAEQAESSDHSLRTGLRAWDYWGNRFLERDPNAALDPVLGGLPRPFATLGDAFSVEGPNPDELGLADDPEARQALRAHADSATEMAIAQLFPPDDARFQPDLTPPPLSVRVLVDPHEDDNDPDRDLEAIYAGTVMLVRRNDTALPGQWAYANLAKLILCGQGARPDEVISFTSIFPQPINAIDGRYEVFLPFWGLPVALPTPGSGQPMGASIPPDLVEAQYPEIVHAGAPIQLLAYGTMVDIAVGAIGHAGSLPLAVQGEYPWHPALINNATAFPFASYAYSRTTAIGAVKIKDDAQGTRINRIPDGVEPLSHAYPRLTLAGAGAQWIDLHRSESGAGLILLPEVGQSETIFIDDVRAWTANAVLGIEVLSKANHDRSGPGAQHNTLPVPMGEDHRIGIVIKRINATDATAHLSLDGQIMTPITIDAAQGRTCWLRLRAMPGPAGTGSITLQDPAASLASGTTAGGRAPIMLLGGETGNWAAPFNRDGQLRISWPRVSILDFRRAMASPSLFSDTFSDPAMGKSFLDAIDGALRQKGLDRAAGQARSDDAAHALLDQLPDPMVRHLWIELAPTDRLDALLDKSTTQALTAQSHILKPSSLGEILADLAGAGPLESGRFGLDGQHVALGALLRAIDERCHSLVTIKTAPNAGIALTHKASDRSITISIQAGVSARLHVRPAVEQRHFDPTSAGVPMIDTRLLQLAQGSVTAGALTLRLFPGDALQLEAMLDRLSVARKREEPPALPWHATRDEWARMTDALVRHEPSGSARNYALSITPDKKRSAEIWRWRQVGRLSTATQRWRFMGIPIQSWASPKAYGHAPIGQASVEIFGHSDDGDEQIRADPSLWLQFEDEAFSGRDDQDVETEPISLLPFGSRTKLIDIAWPSPTATLFRHRFALLSRYLGAMANPTLGEVLAAPTPSHPDQVRAWRRIAVLADVSKASLTSPQLRTIIPMTRGPQAHRLVAPPLVALLQERPYGAGGLAERLTAKPELALEYRFENGTLRIDGMQTELGLDPGHTFTALPKSQSMNCVLLAEGPVGLTFDSRVTSAPAYPNSALSLQLAEIDANGEAVPLDLAFETALVRLTLGRFLDPDWLVRTPFEGATQADHEQSMPLDRSWWIRGSKEALTLAFMRDQDASTPFFHLHQHAGFWHALVAKQALDDTYPHAADFPDPDGQPPAGPGGAPPIVHHIEMATLPNKIEQLAIMLVPLEERRVALSLFVKRHSGQLDLLRTISVVIPKDAITNSVALQAHGAAFAPTSASVDTAPNWSRVSRNFDAVHVADVASLGATRPLQVALIEAALVAREARNPSSLSLVLRDQSLPGKPEIWPRGATGEVRIASHLQSHVAMMMTRSVESFGTPMEQPMQPQMLVGRNPIIDWAPDQNTSYQVRLLEIQMPVVALRLTDGPLLDEKHLRGRFDLTAIGYDRARGDGAPLFQLSCALRLMGSREARKNITRLDFKLQADQQQDQATAEAPIAIEGLDRHFCEDLLVDLSLNAHGDLIGYRTRVITATGDEVRQEPRQLPEPIPLITRESAPVDRRTTGLSFVEFRPGFSTGDPELWAQISMIATKPGTGFQGAMSFDWLFGDKETDIERAKTLAGLHAMLEAQSNLVRFSDPVTVRKLP